MIPARASSPDEPAEYQVGSSNDLIADKQRPAVETLRILVTGGAGFIGSWLVNELVARGHEVTSVDSLLGGRMDNVNKKCRFVKLDLRNFEKTDKLVKGKDVIFHLAAYAAEGQSLFSPIAINDLNITPMNNLLVSSANHAVSRFVFLSSMAIYGNQKPPFREDAPRRPVDPYGLGKAYCEGMLEVFAKNYGFEYVILRPHNVFGPRQNISDPYRNVLGIWMNRIMRGLPPVIYGDGKQTRAFSYIEDVAPAIANATSSRRVDGEIMNVGSDEVASINDACKIVLETSKSKMEPIHVKPRPAEVRHAWCTVKKSIDLLDYRTKHPLGVGVRKMWAWAKQRGASKANLYPPPGDYQEGAENVDRAEHVMATRSKRRLKDA